LAATFTVKHKSPLKFTEQNSQY